MTLKLVERSSLAAGIRIHWIEAGEPTNVSPVVLLHGLNDSHLTWRHVAAELAQDRLVLMPDLPGHGLSERPDESYSLSWYAVVMAEWMATAGLENADLIGHSFGGGVAQVMLLKCRPRIRRLGLVSSGGLGREIAMVLRLASIPYVVEQFGQPFMAFGTRLAARCAGRQAEEIAALSSMNARAGSARAFARTVQDLIDWRGQRHTYHKRIHEVSELPPIHLFWGERDRIIPVSHGKLMAESFDGISLTLFERSGHYLHNERPELFTRALRDFLDEPVLAAARIREGFPQQRHGVSS